MPIALPASFLLFSGPRRLSHVKFAFFFFISAVATFDKLKPVNHFSPLYGLSATWIAKVAEKRELGFFFYFGSMTGSLGFKFRRKGIL